MCANKWLSRELFKSSLDNYYKCSGITVISYNVEPAVPTGDNYTSDITRVNITYRRQNSKNNETTTVIVKCQPRGNLVEKWTTQLHFFKTEIEMFSITLPLMYNILGTEREGCLSSNCLFTTETPNLILVLEDLRPLGYGMSPRREGFDLEHCILVMKKMAIFHAASVVMIEKDPKSVINYSNGLYTRDEVSAEWVRKGFQSLAEACLNWKGFEKYGKKLSKLEDYVVEKGVNAGARIPHAFNVLNHGDLWTNNMLFKYSDDKKLIDIKFIDFQLVKYSSPAVDLHYFYATSPNDEAREYLVVLLDTYYSNLLSTLASLKYTLDKIPTRADFIKDFKERAFYGMLAAATVTPLVKASQRQDATFDELASKDGPGSFREHCYTNPSYSKALQNLLPYYDSLGILEA